MATSKLFTLALCQQSATSGLVEARTLTSEFCLWFFSSGGADEGGNASRAARRFRVSFSPCLILVPSAETRRSSQTSPFVPQSPTITKPQDTNGELFSG
jgi:hypothetical protein